MKITKSTRLWRSNALWTFYCVLLLFHETIFKVYVFYYLNFRILKQEVTRCVDLFGRSQGVTVLGHCLDALLISCGVPQGSIFGPLCSFVDGNDFSDSITG